MSHAPSASARRDPGSASPAPSHALPAAAPQPVSSVARGGKTAAILCVLLTAAYYLLFPSHRYGYDAIEYAYGVKRGHSLFHPHHLLYNAAGRLLYLAIGSIHPVDAIGLLSAQNAILTALSVGLVCLLVHQVTQRVSLAIGLALLFASLRGVTAMATSVEVYPATTLFELCALCLLVRKPRLSVLDVCAIGGLGALACLFHQTGVFFVAAMAYGLWKKQRTLSSPALSLLVALCICGGAYLWVGLFVEHRPVFGLWKWITAYAHSDEYRLGMWGHGLRLRNLPTAVIGLFQVITAPYYLENVSAQFRPSWTECLLSASLLGSLGLWLSLLVRALRAPKSGSHDLRSLHSTRIPSRLDSLGLRPLVRVWLLLHAGFTLWWEPGNFEFWLLLAPPVSLILAVLSLRLDDRSRDHSENTSSIVGVRGQMSASLALLFVGNFGLCTLPSHRGIDNPNAEIYRSLSVHPVDAEDIYIGDLATLQLYFFYYQDKHVPLHSLRFEGYSDPAQKAAVLTAYAARIRSIRIQHRVFFLEHELFEDYDYFDKEDVQKLYAPMLIAATEIGQYHRGANAYRIWQLAPLSAQDSK